MIAVAVYDFPIDPAWNSVFADDGESSVEVGGSGHRNGDGTVVRHTEHGAGDAPRHAQTIEGLLWILHRLTPPVG